MVTPAMATLQYEWRISAEESLAEHKHIEFAFALGGSVARKRLTWTGRSRALQSLSELPWFERVQGADLRSGEALEHVLKKFYLIFDRHVSRNLRVVKSGPHTANSWWTPELGTERSRVRAMRRRYQAARDPAVRAQLRAIFTRARGLYRKNIAWAQEAALKRYCEECSRRSLFGAPFRTAFTKRGRLSFCPRCLRRKARKRLMSSSRQPCSFVHRSPPTMLHSTASCIRNYERWLMARR